MAATLSLTTGVVYLVNFSGTLSGGTFNVAQGTAAAPSIASTAGTTTGLYWISSSQLGIAASGKAVAQFKYQALNSNDNAAFYLGTGANITDTVNDVYTSVIYPPSAVTSTGNTSSIFTAIGQFNVTATDTTTRSRQTANVEMDYTTFAQSGGAVIWSDVVNTRFRFPAVGASVTITDNKGIDFVWPTGLVSGTVTNYECVYFRDPGATVGNKYAIWFEPNYTTHMVSKAGTDITVAPGTTGAFRVNKDALAVTGSSGIKVQNQTAATAGVTVQQSPTTSHEGTAYNSVSTLSETVIFSQYCLPATAAGTTSGTWYLLSGINGAAGTERLRVGSNGRLTVNNGTGNTFSGTFDITSPNQTVGGGGEATGWHMGTKSTTGLVNAAATTFLNASIPNAAHSASIKLTVTGALGAGGAVGADEATGTISYDISITRTAGLATVATISTAYGSATSSVAGGATITIAVTLAAVTGLNSATQTLPIQVAISRGSGSSSNHTCVTKYELINANSSGISVS